MITLTQAAEQEAHEAFLRSGRDPSERAQFVALWLETYKAASAAAQEIAIRLPFDSGYVTDVLVQGDEFGWRLSDLIKLLHISAANSLSPSAVLNITSQALSRKAV